ncbi:ATP-, maltotriose-and DNA-dependent transcriptional regulator MalT [Nocardioides terrae]|uniref:ATP-, maltotriose-and DNA-dependent transcriptional regulator MalT n=1 Tax=Nocardioides terrae TaxID=574651 RepID=A0A1I1KJ68_9ACTN|nr:LuxR C-terminal-related transcriptional regulator [Nocardioides terrae]SFC57470.1 ATP-, maltotriose-and DNA-dependent transcriptional regulator MalT [Nocardioides terrae]
MERPNESPPPPRTGRDGSSAEETGYADVPLLPRVYIPRPTLWDRLDEACLAPLTTLIAPAGAGKTLGVAGWLRSRAGPTPEPPGWIHADASCDPATIMGILDATVPRLLVVDDAHQLPAPTLRALEARLSDAPSSMRVLLVSRSTLSLSLLVPELLGQSTTLRGDLLRLSDAEAAIVAEAHAHTSDPTVIDAIVDQAHGWCAALVLTARAVGASPDHRTAVQRYASGGAAAPERVASEVFAALSPRQRHVLLCAGAEASGVVTEHDIVHLSHDADAVGVLAELEATGFLVTRVPPAAGQRDTARYRTHPLLRDVVRRRLSAGGVDVARAQATVARAVHLDVSRGILRQAFSRLVHAKAIGEAADLLAVDGARLVLMEEDGPAIASFVTEHTDVIEGRPDSWFAIALERWIDGDLEAAGHWIDRILTRESVADGPEAGTAVDGPLPSAVVRLWHARLGLESLDAAVLNGERALSATGTGPGSRVAHGPVLPLLLNELGIAQNWLGRLSDAEAHLTATIGSAQAQGVPALVASAMSHLAFTELMQGREHASARVATEALTLMGDANRWRAGAAPSRATATLTIAATFGPPEQAEGPGDAVIGTPVQAHDPCTAFWLRIRDARQALLSGALVEGERILSTPAPSIDPAGLPVHLRVAELMEQGLLRVVMGDAEGLGSVRRQFEDLGAAGEAQLIAGWLADLRGDRPAALSALGAAGEEPAHDQPATRALALCSEAQLLAASGRSSAALTRLEAAVAVTEARRNATPFLGWARHGTRMRTLLRRLHEVRPSSWLQEVIASTEHRGDIVATRPPARGIVVRPRSAMEAGGGAGLSSREWEVLQGLAKGATYADIAEELFVSVNTVKSHVSGLYAKLGATRRGEALAVARANGFL